MKLADGIQPKTNTNSCLDVLNIKLEIHSSSSCTSHLIFFRPHRGREVELGVGGVRPRWSTWRGGGGRTVCGSVGEENGVAAEGRRRAARNSMRDGRRAERRRRGRRERREAS